MRRLAWFLCGLAVLLALYPRSLDAVAVTGFPGRELESLLHEITDVRLKCLLSGDPGDLERVYDTSTTSGAYAFEHEVGRVRYFREWLSKRSIEILAADASLRIVDSGIDGHRAWASICHNVILTYRRNGSQVFNQMGVRTIHWMEFSRRGERWLISKDWFWDPLGSSPRPRVPAEIAPVPPTEEGRRTAGAESRSYNRGAAVLYADRYCGVKAGAGTGRYNPRYRDFTNLGGDCTNFASQVLADPEAGGLPMDGGWFYEGGQGTNTWICAGEFVGHLLYGGLATLVKRGRYATVAPLVSRLEPGDIIAFEKAGEIKHVSVVTGKDSDGRVVVNSHSADRYRVPWDLGFEEGDVFWLIHITG